MGCFGIYRIPKYKYLLMMEQQQKTTNGVVLNQFLDTSCCSYALVHIYNVLLLFEIGDLLLISRHLLCKHSNYLSGANLIELLGAYLGA
jgi:hypothetical protein